MNPPSPRKRSPCDSKTVGLIATLTLLPAFLLAIHLTDIRFWPTDSYRPYIPAARALPSLPHISAIHTLPTSRLNQLNMRGKEAFICGISFFQRLLQDPRTLFPNILLLTVSVAISGVLVFLIGEELFSPPIGLTALFLFATSFWPYQYILQGAHQPFVLMNFLATAFLLIKTIRTANALRRGLLSLSAGVLLGLTLFSSPTALIYTPYLFAGWFLPRKGPRFLRATDLIWIVLGTALPAIAFTLPDPAANLYRFLRFLLASQKENHFAHPPYREILSRIAEIPPTFRGAGWTWILRYLMRVTPVLTIGYALSALVLLTRGLHERRWVGLILISLSTPLLVETSQVAQIGRNYFSWLPGMLLLTSAALDRTARATKTLHPTARIGLAVFLIAHLLYNGWVFAADVYPTRMGVTHAARYLLHTARISQVTAPQGHPRNLFTTDQINHPGAPRSISIYGITDILQPKGGLILMPPISGKTIYNDCAGKPYTADPFLNTLVAEGALSRYVLVSFPTLGTSRIWPLEEEICAWRELIVRDITEKDRALSRFWILDARRLHRNADAIRDAAGRPPSSTAPHP